jgi:hypothetical protein
LNAEIGQLRLQEMTSGVLEIFLEDKVAQLSPETVNRIRGFALTTFNRARRAAGVFKSTLRLVVGVGRR